MATALLEKVDRTVHATELFSSILDEETAALKKADFKRFQDLQDKKFDLAQSYQDAILSFEDDVDLLKDMDDATKERLRLSYTRFTEASETNERALMTSKNVSERIVTMIMDAARRSVSEGPSYGANARQDLSDKIPVHFKINEVL